MQNGDVDPDTNVSSAVWCIKCYREVEIENQTLRFVCHWAKKLNIVSILIKSININAHVPAVSETCETVPNTNSLFLQSYVEVSNSRQYG